MSQENKVKTSRPFGLRDKLGYMIGNIGNDLTFFLASNYFMVFYTNVMGVSPATVGTLFGIARLVDAFTDVGMGVIVDNAMTTRVGKFKPWLRRMAFPVGIASALMYNSFIVDWSPTAKVIYMFITYLLWGSIFYTSINIPYGSLASVVSGKAEDRANLSTFRSIGSTLIQFSLGFVVPLIAYSADGKVLATNFTWLAIALGLAAAVCYLLCYGMVEERVELPQGDKFSAKAMLTDILELIQDRGFLGLMFSTMFMLAGLISLGQLLQYTYLDFFQNTRILPIATAGMTLSALVVAPFVSTITKKFGKKEAGSFALIGAGAIYLIAFVLKIQSPLVFAILVIVAGIVMGYYMMAMYAFVTDVIDDFYVKRGTRKDGTIYAVYSFTRKVGQAIAGFLAGALLTAIGYQSGVEQQTAEVANSIYNVGTLLPGALLLAAGLILLFMYPLNKQKVNENTRIIESENQ
ncbi:MULTISPECIES: MFS transporter [Aerococcus]|uniref:MFS transporter n=1 Tax=Aerococcus viridans TaxID=1377 RepID=A0A2N6UCE8_9LACT|nr:MULTISPECIES: glycoside-pentoside-hexuronide (GPH):cation symporter [Aerococcus]OFU52025.1 hypothetical protein HMPREF3116_02880 [Aerococcus sp. HMSC10H05]PMC79225.1 MFS transporter [Aerococcus viridans]